MTNDKHDIHKQNWLHAIFRYGKWYLLSSLFTKGVNIFLLPIYTRFLTPADYGILNSLNSICALLPIFISLYLDSAFGRYFHEKKHDPRQLQEFFSTIYWFIVIYGSLVIAIAIGTSGLWIPGLLHVPIWPYAYIAFIPVLFLQIGQIGIVFLRQSLLARQTTALEITTTAITIAVTLPLLVAVKMGVLARLIGISCGALFLFSFYTVYFVRRKLLVLSFDRKVLKMCLAYSVPMIPNTAGGWITQFSDRIIIAKYANLASVGLYSVGANLAQIIYMLQDSITQVSGPISMSGLVSEREKTKDKIARFSLLLLGFMLLAHLLMVLFSQEAILTLATRQYSGAYIAVAIISFTYVLSSQYRIFSDIVAFHKKTWVFPIAGILMALLSLFLNFIFVPKFGYAASAVTNVVSVLAYTLVIFVAAQSFDKINIHWKRSVVLLGLHICIIYLSMKSGILIVSIGNCFLKAGIFVIAAIAYYTIVFGRKGFAWARMRA